MEEKIWAWFGQVIVYAAVVSVVMWAVTVLAYREEICAEEPSGYWINRWYRAQAFCRD